MKRFHAHIAVSDISDSIAFYSKLFNQAPSNERHDYAKWELDDLRVNFAISSRGHTPGLNHFGFQAENAAELEQLKRNADHASPDNVMSEEAAACCYAKSDKHWTVDPQGIAWESFLTMEGVAEFGLDNENLTGACCVPMRVHPEDEPGSNSPCCIPNEQTAGSGCCG
ncbi:MAG: glyoxalase/bleomycin resistance/dioxygenase family protein [Sphingorhabdus sp.]|uniref:glyoxalase/bleomycin resistance/dioxygenase family protein n=1 Tax=Sphingorhabdus sp. TaxID=1902408 RepID=UPI0038FC9460